MAGEDPFAAPAFMIFNCGVSQQVNKSSFSPSAPFYKKSYLLLLPGNNYQSKSANQNQLPPLTNCCQLLLPQVHLMVSILFPAISHGGKQELLTSCSAAEFEKP